VVPGGILPFGHLLALELDHEPAGIAELSMPPVAPAIAATFTTELDPGGPIRDAIVEAFDSAAREERGREAFLAASPLGAFVPADWNGEAPSVLQAALAFDGSGALGRFAPVAPPDGTTLTIVIDTSEQRFPMLDGSTPDAKHGTVVRGGRFEFSEIDIPARVVVIPSGPNPLVLCATGGARIGGTIALAGANGTPEIGKGDDRAYTSIPGGHAVAGGGRGGDSHPAVTHPPDQLSFLALVSPVAAETGFGIDPVDGVMKRRGGGGAVNGILEQIKNGKYQTDNELGNCDEFRNGNGPCKIGGGGGGGAMLRPGRFAADKDGNRLDGIANVTPDGQGGFLFDPAVTTLPCGDPGAHPFVDDGSTLNDFFGPLGQLKRLIGGQGGGGGGGAGGAIVLQSGTGIWIEAGAVLDVRHGRGNDAANDNAYFDCSTAGENPGDGGHGGDGLIQLQVPAGMTATVVDPGTSESNGSIRPPASWLDSANVLAPAEFTPISMALSRWHDCGRMIARGTAGVGPLFGCRGIGSDGLVVTEPDGRILDPAALDIEIGYLGQVDAETGAWIEGEEPRADWIPTNATVRIEFQGADAIAPGSREVDPATLTDWSGNAAIADGSQFLRWRITFDLTADGSTLSPRTRRPIVERLEVALEC
jgi:hypothetical protein